MNGQHPPKRRTTVPPLGEGNSIPSGNAEVKQEKAETVWSQYQRNDAEKNGKRFFPFPAVIHALYNMPPCSLFADGRSPSATNHPPAGRLFEKTGQPGFFDKLLRRMPPRGSYSDGAKAIPPFSAIKWRCSLSVYRPLVSVRSQEKFKRSSAFAVAIFPGICHTSRGKTMRNGR